MEKIKKMFRCSYLLMAIDWLVNLKPWTNPQSTSFFVCGNPRDHSATLQRSIFAKFGHETYLRLHFSVSRRWIRKVIFENFYFRGHLSPKSEIENPSNRHLTRSRNALQRETEKYIYIGPYCLLQVVVQGPGSFRYNIKQTVRHT